MNIFHHPAIWIILLAVNAFSGYLNYQRRQWPWVAVSLFGVILSLFNLIGAISLYH